MRWLILLMLLGCEEDLGPACRMVDRCATVACSQFPTTTGCTFMAPVNGRCPIGHPQCFDPTRHKDYCNPQNALCAKPRDPVPATCPARLCGSGDVAVCNEIGGGVFCQDGHRCLAFDDCPDAGTQDAGTDARPGG
jgi:hypothetical protein